MSVRGFAAYLGVPVRTVSKWEQSGTGRVPRPEFQAMLDTALQRLDDDQRARFESTFVAGGEEPTNRRQFIVAAAALPVMTPPVPTWATQVRSAVPNPGNVMREAGQLDPVCVVDTARLARKMIGASLRSDHTTLVRQLPLAIGQVEWGATTSQDDARSAQLQAVSDVLATAAWTLIKADDCSGAWVAARRAIDAAEEADDVLRLAAATRCLAEVHMRAGQLGDAGRLAFLAATHLDSATSSPTQPEIVRLRGAALLSAAAAAARRGDAHEATAGLKVAARCADQLRGERADLGTVFGPTNMAIHRVAVAVELGDAKAALEHSRAVRLSQLPIVLKERRARFTIDVARAHVALHDDSASVAALLDAERQSPDETRTHRHTHALVRTLLARRPSLDARRLADRCGLVA